jgi:hypothetical protein
MGIDRFAHRGIRADHAGERDGMAVGGDHDVRVVDDGAPLDGLADAIGDVARDPFGRERDEVLDPEHAVDAADCQFSGLPLERVPDAAAELDVTVASSTWPHGSSVVTSAVVWRSPIRLCSAMSGQVMLSSSHGPRG